MFILASPKKKNPTRITRSISNEPHISARMNLRPISRWRISCQRNTEKHMVQHRHSARWSIYLIHRNTSMATQIQLTVRVPCAQESELIGIGSQKEERLDPLERIAMKHWVNGEGRDAARKAQPNEESGKAVEAAYKRCERGKFNNIEIRLRRVWPKKRMARPLHCALACSCEKGS